MTDPGWDIPGVPRDASPGSDAPPAAGGSASRASSSFAAAAERLAGRARRQVWSSGAGWQRVGGFGVVGGRVRAVR